MFKGWIGHNDHIISIIIDHYVFCVNLGGYALEITKHVMSKFKPVVSKVFWKSHTLILRVNSIWFDARLWLQVITKPLVCYRVILVSYDWLEQGGKENEKEEKIIKKENERVI